MINNKDYEIDVFLKVTNQEDKTAYKIIEEHMKVIDENPDRYTWWGNNQPFSPVKVQEFKQSGHDIKALMVIPVSSGGSGNIEYIADIVESIKDNQKCYSPDKWVPNYYINDEHKVWIKLKNLRRVNVNRDRIDISQYFILSNNKRLDTRMDSQYACGYVYRHSNNNEELNEENYQDLILTAKATKTCECPQKKTNPKDRVKGKVWERNPSIAKEALNIADYKCELDESHITFISSNTGKNFVEAHHLIPMKYQGDFENSIDVPGNIIAMCPTCHRKIHLCGINEKKDMLKSLYSQRKDKLDRYGISVDLDELLSMYMK